MGLILAVAEGLLTETNILQSGHSHMLEEDFNYPPEICKTLHFPEMILLAF